MITRFDPSRGLLASCPECGRVKPQRSICVHCAERIMRTMLLIQNALDERNEDMRTREGSYVIH